ncbi:hypothetical protein [Acinetobacter sp. CFCC 10889]|uniref:hypothetical protein n=1 Tax=Acinetobacter sp. CFCC 10889 TaxID=1775557 RepID=UPI000DD00471|nr:hypothetical protein [Acinetobacter sp. CFCC 10889]
MQIYNKTLEKSISRLHYESLLFGFLGLLIFIFSGSILVSIFGYLSLYYIYKSFKAIYDKNQTKSSLFLYNKKYIKIKKNISFILKIFIFPLPLIIFIPYLIHSNFAKILIIIYLSLLLYAIFYYFPILLLNLIYSKIRSSFQTIILENKNEQFSEAEPIQLTTSEEKPLPAPTSFVHKQRRVKIKQPVKFEFNPQDSSLKQIFELKQYFQSNLGLRHRRQLNELHQIFQDIENKNASTHILITQRQALKNAQEICLEQTLDAITLFLDIPKEERLRFNQNLNNVPDLWFTQTLNKCIANLLKEIEPLYTHDLQSLLDHEKFLQQSLKQESDFKIDNK